MSRGSTCAAGVLLANHQRETRVHLRQWQLDPTATDSTNMNSPNTKYRPRNMYCNFKTDAASSSASKRAKALSRVPCSTCELPRTRDKGAERSSLPFESALIMGPLGRLS